MVVAGAIVLPYYFAQHPPLWAPVLWGLLFIGINVVQIGHLLMERRPVHMTEPEQRLYRAAFRSLTPREFVRLTKLGRWEEATSADCIVEQGTLLNTIMIILSGKVAVKVDGRTVATLEEGRFIGEMSYLTGGPTSARVEAMVPTKYITWQKNRLDEFLNKNTEMRAALQLVIGRDLVAKLAMV
jgi:CRP-like cAMP-binding protein